MAPGGRGEPPRANHRFLRNARGRRTNLLPFLFGHIRTESGPGFPARAARVGWWERPAKHAIEILSLLGGTDFEGIQIGSPFLAVLHDLLVTD